MFLLLTCFIFYFDILIQCWFRCSQLDFMKGWPIERLLEHPEHCLLHFFKWVHILRWYLPHRWPMVRCPLRERQACVRFSLCRGSFPSDLKVGSKTGYQARHWRYRVSAGTGLPGISILWLGEIERLSGNFSVLKRVHLSEQIRPWDTQARCWEVGATSKQTSAGSCFTACFVWVSQYS